jgi:hypothetical protein
MNQMKHLSIITVIFCIFLFQACSNTNKNTNEDSGINAKIITIDLNQKMEENNIQNIASSMTFLELEESDDFPIGFINKILVTNTLIYILDIQRAKSLFIYDRDGHLKKVIDKVGIGPGEFVTPSDFAIQKSTGNLVILDGNQRKLIFYTKQGDFISELKLNTFIGNFTTTNNDDIILDKGNFISDKSTNYIRIINKEGTKLTELLPVPEFVREMTIRPRNPLQHLQDTVLFMPSLNNSIYQINGNEIKLRYKFDFGGKWPSKEYFANEKGKHPLKIAQNLMKNNYVAFLNYLETKDILHVNFEYQEKPYSLYYNKVSGKFILFYSSNEMFPIATDKTSFVYVRYIEDRNPGLIFCDIKW